MSSVFNVELFFLNKNIQYLHNWAWNMASATGELYSVKTPLCTLHRPQSHFRPQKHLVFFVPDTENLFLQKDYVDFFHEGHNHQFLTADSPSFWKYFGLGIGIGDIGQWWQKTMRRCFSKSRFKPILLQNYLQLLIYQSPIFAFWPFQYDPLR